VAAQSGCLRCHTVDGTPHIGPTWAGLYGAEIPLQGGQEVAADAKYLTESMMDPTAKVHLGFRPVMPSYQGLLGAVEIGSVVEYIRTLADAPRRSLAEPLPIPVPGQVPLVQPLPPPREPAPAPAPGGAP
jgi:cytochrome c oxidase subunit 2